MKEFRTVIKVHTIQEFIMDVEGGTASEALLDAKDALDLDALGASTQTKREAEFTVYQKGGSPIPKAQLKLDL